MKYYIIAGEPSGDLHAANLIQALRQEDPALHARGFGGDKMKHEGAEIVRHYRDLAFMGFWEVAINIRAILGHLSFCKKDILAYQPDVVILVDYPGFNFRMGEFLRKKNIRVFYYISPQIWAWHVSRVNKIKKWVNRMFVILPFEKEFYAHWNYEVDFVGHPLLDALQKLEHQPRFHEKNHLNEQPIIAVLPGSRKQEISRMLPVMLSASNHFPEYQFVVAGLSHLGTSFYHSFLKNNHTRLVIDQTYDLLKNAHAALVTSGTATLETALFNVPQVVCYKGSFFSYLIGRMLVKVPFISLVNLITGKKVVEELLQNQLTEKSLQAALTQILQNETREKMLEDYGFLRKQLGEAGASSRAAKLMVKYLSEGVKKTSAV